MKTHISNLGLENFRVFKEKIHFDFAPITILTGTNSSGKSSLINAMEILAKSQRINEAVEENSADIAILLNTFSKALKFCNYTLSPSSLNKRYGGFKTFINKASEDGLITFHHKVKLQYWQTACLLSAKYQKNEIDNKVGNLVNILITDWENEEIIFELRCNNDDMISFVNYAFFFDKLENYVKGDFSDESESHVKGDFKITTFPNPWIRDNEAKDLGTDFSHEKRIEILNEFLSSGAGYYLYNFSPKPKHIGPDYDDVENVWNKEEVESFIKKSMEKYAVEINEFSSFREFEVAEEKKFLSNFVTIFKKKPFIDHRLMLEAILYIANPLASRRWDVFGVIENKSFISDYKKCQFSSPVFNEEHKLAINFIFKSFIAGNIIKAINYAILPESQYLGANRVDVQRSYSDYEEITVNKFIRNVQEVAKFVAKELTSENKFVTDFLSKSLKHLEIADYIEIASGADDSSSLIYISKNGEKTLLADVGYGVSQILAFLVVIAIEVGHIVDRFHFSGSIEYDTVKDWLDEEWNTANSSIIIEEPEANLHPANQSKLADIIIDAAQNFGIQFIIETHSEYLIRKLQYLTAKGKIKPEDTVIYYFYPPDDVPPEEPQVKRIDIGEDGSLSDDFGRGFFDEADNLAIDLYTLLTQNRKN